MQHDLSVSNLCYLYYSEPQIIDAVQYVVALRCARLFQTTTSDFPCFDKWQTPTPLTIARAAFVVLEICAAAANFTDEQKASVRILAQAEKFHPFLKDHLALWDDTITYGAVKSDPLSSMCVSLEKECRMSRKVAIAALIVLPNQRGVVTIGYNAQLSEYTLIDMNAVDNAGEVRSGPIFCSTTSSYSCFEVLRNRLGGAARDAVCQWLPFAPDRYSPVQRSRLIFFRKFFQEIAPKYSSSQLFYMAKKTLSFWEQVTALEQQGVSQTVNISPSEFCADGIRMGWLGLSEVSQKCAAIAALNATDFLVGKTSIPAFGGLDFDSNWLSLIRNMVIIETASPNPIKNERARHASAQHLLAFGGFPGYPKRIERALPISFMRGDSPPFGNLPEDLLDTPLERPGSGDLLVGKLLACLADLKGVSKMAAVLADGDVCIAVAYDKSTGMYMLVDSHHKDNHGAYIVTTRDQDEFDEHVRAAAGRFSTQGGCSLLPLWQRPYNVAISESMALASLYAEFDMYSELTDQGSMPICSGRISELCEPVTQAIRANNKSSAEGKTATEKAVKQLMNMAGEALHEIEKDDDDDTYMLVLPNGLPWITHNQVSKTLVQQPKYKTTAAICLLNAVDFLAGMFHCQKPNAGPPDEPILYMLRNTARAIVSIGSEDQYSWIVHRWMHERAVGYPPHGMAMDDLKVQIFKDLENLSLVSALLMKNSEQRRRVAAIYQDAEDKTFAITVLYDPRLTQGDQECFMVMDTNKYTGGCVKMSESVENLNKHLLKYVAAGKQAKFHLMILHEQEDDGNGNLQGKQSNTPPTGVTSPKQRKSPHGGDNDNGNSPGKQLSPPPAKKQKTL